MEIDNTKTKTIKCSHYNGDGYTYNLRGMILDLCSRCEKKLRKQIFEQDKDEKECRILVDKMILKIRKNKNGQKRVTIPKDVKSDYVRIEEIK